MSPYSVKVRSYFNYKNIPYEWIVRGPWNLKESSELAKLPLIPLVVTPSGDVLQDSTPIIDHLESLYPSPSIHPENDSLRFISALIEEYGDEWGNKIMFHFRWWHIDDQNACARVLAHSRVTDDGDIEAQSHSIRERMSKRRYFTGSSEENAPLIKTYRDNLLAILEEHLRSRRYLFGNSPAFADFGLAPELYELASDPTGGGVMKTRSPHTLAWCHRMLEPHGDGTFQTWAELEPTLAPLLKNAGDFFLPWSSANLDAVESDDESFSVYLAGQEYSQKPQKYHAKSLRVLQKRLTKLNNRDELDQILESNNCLKWLQ